MDKEKEININEILTEALNFEGKFFENLVIDKVKSINPWEIVKVEYPFSDYVDKSPRADFIAKRDGEGLLYLTGEIKKAHPNFKRWVFFPYKKAKSSSGLPDVYFMEEHISIAKTEIKKELRLILCHHLFLNSDLFFCNDAREIAFSKKDKKPTSNERIENGAMQVCLSLNSFANEEYTYLQHLVNTNEGFDRLIRFIPVLITNADLLVCETNDKKLNENFDLDKNSAIYIPVKWLVYKYPINYKALTPTPLRVTNLEVRDYMKYKMIYVVNYNALEEFLKVIHFPTIIMNPKYTGKSFI
ncbi:hypothetical protein HYV80_02995 [Candidatus Woesearchaeota archaeon]|nr:hypothetical protein [Candidatus Woesearchaeota archaeon]